MDNRYSDEKRVAELWGSIRDELRRRGADAQTAEDIAQDTWLIAMRRPPRERERLRGWMRVVAIRLWRRSNSREDDRPWRELPAARSEILDRERPEQAQGQEPTLLRRYVDELPEPYRTTLRLRFFEGCEIAEIAARSSIKSATVHTHIKRGLARLRRRLEPGAAERERLWSPLAWLAWLRSRVESRPGTALQLLGGTGLVATGALSAWILSDSPARPGLDLVLPREISALRDATGSQLAASERASRDSAARLPAQPTPVPVSAARLAGIVRTPEGEPLAGARVHVADARGTGALHSSTTDEHGRYEIAADGELLWASHPEWCESARQYVPSLRGRAQLDLVLHPTRGSAEVRVVSHAGLPVAGARVLLDASRTSQQLTTSDGRLVFQGTSPGATTDDHGRSWIRFPEQVETELFVLPAQQPGWHGLVPTPTPGASLRIDLPGPLAVTGTCLDEAGRPLREARVEVVQLAGLVQREAQTDSDGSFRIDGLAPGDFTLRAREAGARRSSARHAGWLEPGQEQRIALELGERSSILGIILDAHGPVPGARVELEMWNVPPAEGTRRTELTDEQGLFAFAGCAPTLAHFLQVFLPGAAESCIGVGQLRPGKGAARYVVPAPDTELAPLELEFSGADVPVLIELRRAYPALSAIVAPSAPGSGSFRSPPLPAGGYQVFAWHPVLGTWQADGCRHDPRRPALHPFSWPATATLAIELELPQGVAPDEIEVALLVPSFHRNGLGSFGTGNARRVLPWSEPEHAFVATLAPGEYPLLVRGKGLAEIHETIALAPGDVRRRSFAAWHGVETTVFFESPVEEPVPPGHGRSRGLLPAESVQLDALTPTGSTRLELLSRDLRRVEGGFEFTVWLPRTTTELRARTASTQAESYRPREGSHLLEPGTLEAAGGRPRIRIALSNVPL